MDAARPIFGLFGAEDRLRSHVNDVPGTHNFEQENREKFYAMIGDFFFPGDLNFARAEIPSEAELKSAEELNVPLPEENVDFHKLAQRLAASLSRDRPMPTDRSSAESWQRRKRDALRSLLKVPDYKATVAEAKERTEGDLRIVTRLMKIDGVWTVPTVELAPAAGEASGIVLLVADEGRSSAATEAARLVSAGKRVVAVDPFLFGESKIAAQDPEYTFPLFVQAVGQRPLGIQAAQLMALARWLSDGDRPIELRAVGRRASGAALVAAALEPQMIGAVDLSGALSSFKQLIDEDIAVEKLPELFPFGLLAEFDVAEIAALVAPRPVAFHDHSERGRRELSPLRPWYALFGATFDPAF
jgi:hypothetical protein